MEKNNNLYGIGLVLVMFGGSGIAENVTSNRGSFLPCLIIFGIGFGCILMSYVRD